MFAENFGIGKIIIPIPNASKLVQEKGLFWYSEGAENNLGYTFWIDELRFEKVGNTALVNPFIFNGNERTADGFVGGNQFISQIGAIYNLSNGQNISINAAPSYFNFSSSNTSVTGPFQLNDIGQMYTTVIGSSGTAVITATLGNAIAHCSKSCAKSVAVAFCISVALSKSFFKPPPYQR